MPRGIPGSSTRNKPKRTTKHAASRAKSAARRSTRTTAGSKRKTSKGKGTRC